MKGAYIVLTHKYTPVLRGPDKGKTQVHETCEFVDRVRDKHLYEATVIMDVYKRKLLKNRAKEQGAVYEDMEAHMIKGYADKYTEFLKLVGAPLPPEPETPVVETAEAVTEVSDGSERQEQA